MVIKEMGRPLPVIVQLVRMLQSRDASLVASMAAALVEGGTLPVALQQLLLLQAAQPSALECGMTAGLPFSLQSGPQMIAPTFPVC